MLNLNHLLTSRHARRLIVFPVAVCLLVLLTSYVSLATSGVLSSQAYQKPAADSVSVTDQERVEKNRQTLLGRMKREKVIYRGDKPGEVRIRWEWCLEILNSYNYQKRALLTELSADNKFDLRYGWVFKDMKVTFQELFQLGPEDDDKLLPLMADPSMIAWMPRASFDGLHLLGKQGEVKGVVIRKYKAKRYYYEGGLIASVYLTNRLEYKDSNGKLTWASGIAPDAITVRWKDIKNRIVEEVSTAKDLEDLALERDALFPEETAKKQ